MIKVNKNLALFSILFFFLTALLLGTIEKISPLLRHATYYCQSWLMGAHMIPVPYYLSVIPFVFLMLIITISLIKFIALNINAQFLKFRLKRTMVTDQSVSNMLSKLGLQNKVILVQSDNNFAFCLGIIKPTIYLSTSLLTQLSEKELEVILRHEQYHLVNNDSFTMIIASVTQSLFPFFPLVGELIKQYRVAREIAADKFAVAKTGHKSALISVLKKLLGTPTIDAVSVAAIADQDTLEPRIFSLVNKPYTQRQFSRTHLLVTIISSFILISAFAIPVHAKELHHEQHDILMLCTDRQCMNSCTSPKNLDKFYSELPISQKTHLENASHPYTPVH